MENVGSLNFALKKKETRLKVFFILKGNCSHKKYLHETFLCIIWKLKKKEEKKLLMLI